MIALVAGCGSSDGDDGGAIGVGDAIPQEALATGTIGDAEVSLWGDLPAGISSADLTIAEIDAPALDPSSNVEPIAAFELGPDGATFDQPLLLAIELPGLVVGPVVARHVPSDGTGEIIALELARYDAEAGRTTYVARLSHFSTIFVGSAPAGEGPEAALLPEVPRERYAVGESFTVRISVPLGGKDAFDWARTSDDTSGRPSEHLSSIDDADWYVNPTWFVSGRDLQTDFDLRLLPFAPLETDGPRTAPAPLEPRSIDADRVNLDGSVSAATIEQTFLCAEPGPFNISFWSVAYRPYRVREIYPDGRTVEAGQRTLGRSDSIEATGECVSSDGTTGTSSATPMTAAETATATASPTPRVITGGEGVPDIVLPAEPLVPTPVVPGQVLDGYILVYAYDGVWYDGSAMAITPAHEPFCTYEHLHGGTTASILPGADGNPVFISEMYGECGYGPSSALYWIEDPR